MLSNDRNTSIRRVWELKDPVSEDWNLNLLKSIFTNDSASAILKIRWPSNNGEGDKLLWKDKNSGAFSVKSSYDLNFFEDREYDDMWAKLNSGK